MHMTTSIFGLQLHWYGLLVGLALAVWWELGWWWLQRIRNNLTDFNVSRRDWDSWWLRVVVAALVGARVWHVVTDFPWYLTHWWQVPQIWQGGLSIVGALLTGGLVGWYLKREKNVWLAYADATALSLPVAQIIGRLGNWVNQEVYGLPSTAPWAIVIDSAHREPGFEQFKMYHPLFLYESIGLVVFLVLVWSWYFVVWPKFRKGWGLPAGFPLGLMSVGYMLWYSLLRFGLDFWRVQVSSLAFGGIPINQWIMTGFAVVALWGGWQVVGKLAKEHNWPKKQVMRWHRLWYCLAAGVILVWVSLLFFGWGQQPMQQTLSLKFFDHRQVVMLTPTGKYQVEVVNQPQSLNQGLSQRTSLGSDGMLFVLPKSFLPPRFWMKDMQFDLDLVWLQNGVVTGVTPAKADSYQSKQIFSPPTFSDQVLEIPLGQAQQMGLVSGTKVTFWSSQSGVPAARD